MTRLPRMLTAKRVIAAMAVLAILTVHITQAQDAAPPTTSAEPPAPGITAAEDARSDAEAPSTASGVQPTDNGVPADADSTTPSPPPQPPSPEITDTDDATPNATPAAADVSPSSDVTSPPDDDAATAESDGVEVLTHGPVHEAFAQPMPEDMDEGLIVPEAPPEPIDEVPPEYMPEGDNVEWIPGYWAWDSDEDHEGYVWVSGLWRNVPPGQRWVPGHWTEVDGGYRWVAGFWTGTQTADLNYLPYPPDSLEQGPNVAAPDDQSFWVPGSWIYQSNNYQWQPGYWAPGYDNWCWTPQRYVWTPNGALYSPGYWDYRLPYRGLLFAPVRFRNRFYYYGGGRRYVPYGVINPAALLVSLFVRPRYNHYYFGNYYGNRYLRRGFRPWYNRSYGGRYRYDPLYAFYNSYYGRRGVNFSGRMQGWYNYYNHHPGQRPPRTWAAATHLAGRGNVNVKTPSLTLAHSLKSLANANRNGPGNGGNRANHPGNWNFRKLSASQQVAVGRSAEGVRDLMRHRSTLENHRAAAKVGAAGKVGASGKVDAGANLAHSGRPDDVHPGRNSGPQGHHPAGTLKLPQHQSRARDILGPSVRAGGPTHGQTPHRADQPRGNIPRQANAQGSNGLPDRGTPARSLRGADQHGNGPLNNAHQRGPTPHAAAGPNRTGNGRSAPNIQPRQPQVRQPQLRPPQVRGQSPRSSNGPQVHSAQRPQGNLAPRVHAPQFSGNRGGHATPFRGAPSARSFGGGRSSPGPSFHGGGGFRGGGGGHHGGGGFHGGGGGHHGGGGGHHGGGHR